MEVVHLKTLLGHQFYATCGEVVFIVSRKLFDLFALRLGKIILFTFGWVMCSTVASPNSLLRYSCLRAGFVLAKLDIRATLFASNQILFGYDNVISS